MLPVEFSRLSCLPSVALAKGGAKSKDLFAGKDLYVRKKFLTEMLRNDKVGDGDVKGF